MLVACGAPARPAPVENSASELAPTRPWTRVRSVEGPIAVGTPVRMAGIPVGRVIVVSGDRLELDLDDDVDLYENATTRVKPGATLGEEYVDLDPGTADRPRAPAGSEIRSLGPLTVRELQEQIDRGLPSVPTPVP